MINPNKEWEEKAEKLSNFSNLQLKKLCDLNRALEQCDSELHSAYPYYNSVHSITSYYHEISLDIDCGCEYSMQVGCMSSRTYIPDSIESLFQGETLGYPFAYFLSALPVQKLEDLLEVKVIYSNLRIECMGRKDTYVENYHRRGTHNKNLFKNISDNFWSLLGIFFTRHPRFSPLNLRMPCEKAAQKRPKVAEIRYENNSLVINKKYF